MKRFPFFLRTSLRRRGRELMSLWQAMVNELGNGDSATAEAFYPRLASYRRRAMRIALKLRTAV